MNQTDSEIGTLTKVAWISLHVVVILQGKLPKYFSDMIQEVYSFTHDMQNQDCKKRRLLDKTVILVENKIFQTWKKIHYTKYLKL